MLTYFTVLFCIASYNGCNLILIIQLSAKADEVDTILHQNISQSIINMYPINPNQLLICILFIRQMCDENTVLPGLSHKISQVNCWYCAFFLLRIHLLLLLIVYDASFAIKLVIQKSRRKNRQNEY